MSNLISRQQFDESLKAIQRPTRPDEYDDLVKAIGDARISSKHELALFLANIYHESDGLRYKAEIGRGAGQDYKGGARYHGRGYIQLTHIYNYKSASEAIFNDESVLVNNPERVENEGWLAWAVTAWFWREEVKPKGIGSLEDTVRTINSRELNGHSTQFERRRQFLNAINAVLGGDGASAPTGGSGSSYTVQPGDSLSAIGQKFNVPWQDIARNNNIPDPNQIRPGMTLNIGGASAPAGGSGTSYTVQPGDTLSAIGQKYNMSWQEIARKNNIPDPNQIRPGMRLNIN